MIKEYTLKVAKTGRYMYYGVKADGKRSLVKIDDIPQVVMDNLTPNNSEYTYEPNSTNPNPVLADAEDGVSDDTSVIDDKGYNTESITEAGVVDMDEPEKNEPQDEASRAGQEPEPANKSVIDLTQCLFQDGGPERNKFVNLVSVRLCENCYQTKTTGKVVQEINRQLK